MDSVEQMLKMEEKVFTVNPYYMQIFTDMKNRESQSNLDNAWIKVIPSFLFVAAGTNVNPASPDNTAPKEVMIGLRAYCSIVHARIVDQLFQLCEYWFIRNGVLILDGKLSTAFTPAELLKSMKEPPFLEQKRANLKRTIDAMERALAAAESD